MNKYLDFKQGNGEIVPVTISNDSKKRFGSLGYMWIVNFDNGTSQYMTKDWIFEATGVDMSKRGGIYHRSNQALLKTKDA
jgi:hypothetical protein